MQGMNIYLWVASDRCWGEDSRILQFDEGNNWNRLMRNILPNGCLPSAIATPPPLQQSSSTHQPLASTRTGFIKVRGPKGCRYPNFGVSHPERRQAAGERAGASGDLQLSWGKRSFRQVKSLYGDCPSSVGGQLVWRSLDGVCVVWP